jgi:hypothetical protein
MIALVHSVPVSLCFGFRKREDAEFEMIDGNNINVLAIITKLNCSQVLLANWPSSFVFVYSNFSSTQQQYQKQRENYGGSLTAMTYKERAGMGFLSHWNSICSGR